MDFATIHTHSGGALLLLVGVGRLGLRFGGSGGLGMVDTVLETGKS